MLNTILFWILRLAPLEPTPQTHAVADAIAAVVEDRREAAILSTISFAETRFGHEGAAFGACAHLCRHHCGVCHEAPLEDVARWALVVLKTGERLCGHQLATVLGFYHSGRCVPDAFSRMEARIAMRLVNEADQPDSVRHALLATRGATLRDVLVARPATAPPASRRDRSF